MMYKKVNIMFNVDYVNANIRYKYWTEYTFSRGIKKYL
jgi:hypothetical protein